jgi:hypothetical protein
LGAAGAVLQDVYLTGANFISTTQVLFNGSPVANTDLVSSTVLRARLSDANLKTPGTFEFRALRQGSTNVGCTDSGASAPCTLTLTRQRPAIAGTTPDSFPQGSAPTIAVDGGYFGPASGSTVTAQFGSQPAAGSIQRQPAHHYSHCRQRRHHYARPRSRQRD